MVSETIDSGAYVLGISKATVIQSLYKLFYNRVINGVTDTHSPSRTKWWYSAWPDENIDNASIYPIGIIESPDIEWAKSTLTRKTANALIDITIHHTHAGQLDVLSDQIINAVETSRAIFREVNVRFINLVGTTNDNVVRDKITIHSKTMTFSCTYNFTGSVI